MSIAGKCISGILLSLALYGCAAAGRIPVETPVACSPPVDPIRDSRLVVVISYDFSYQPEDAAGAREWSRPYILDQLNAAGMSDGNAFEESNGQPVNFYFEYMINNDGQDHFSGSVELSGWGQGHIVTLYSGESPYSDPTRLLDDLTSKAYGFIHTGWYDSRPGCPQS
jgi:hypothetical protein